MESRDVLHESATSEELSQTCIDQTTCVKVPAQDVSQDIADHHQSQDHQSHNHQSLQFGRNLHIAMACINGADLLQRNKSIKADSNQQSISNTTPRQRTRKELSSDIHRVSAEIDTHRAELFELLVQFDEQQGRADSGARNCADWVNAHLGIGQSSAYQFLRVGRELRELPIIRALFR